MKTTNIKHLTFNIFKVIQTFLIVYAFFIFCFYLIYLIYMFIFEWFILHGIFDKNLLVFFVKESSDPLFNLNLSHVSGQSTFKLPLMDIDKAQGMSLQEKIAYTLAILDINLVVGIDLKGFSNGIYGIVHLGAEASSLSQNLVFKQINPYSVILKIPFAFLHTNTPYITDLVTFWISTMEPCHLKTMINITENNCYGLPQTNTFSTQFTVFKTDTFSMSFGLKIPFDSITEPKKYVLGCSFNIY